LSSYLLPSSVQDLRNDLASKSCPVLKLHQLCALNFRFECGNVFAQHVSTADFLKLKLNSLQPLQRGVHAFDPSSVKFKFDLELLAKLVTVLLFNNVARR